MSLWSWTFLAVLAVIVPYLSLRSLRVVASGDLSRPALYANASASLWAIAAVGYLVIRLDGQTLADVYVRSDLPGTDGWRLLLWTGGLAAGGLLIFAVSHLVRPHLGLADESSMLHRLRPANAPEALLLILLVSPSAGICEEFLYRGFLISRLGALAASQPIGTLLSAILFGLAHLYQGWLGAVRAGIIALLLAAPVLSLGTILPAMAAHALIDALGILWLWPFLEHAWPRQAAC